MTVRNVVEGTLAIVVLLVLALIGWETYLATNEIAGMKAEMAAVPSPHDPAESANGFAANIEPEGNHPKVSLVSNVMPVVPEANEKPPVVPPTVSPSARNVEPDVSASAQLKSLGDDLQKTKQELADVKAKLEANIEATQIARLDLGRIVKKDMAGNPIVAIREMTQNAEFKDDFRKAVNEVVERPAPPPPQGKIRLDNRMPVWEYLEVNGLGFWVGPSSYLDVVVPPGVATTRLPGYEAAKSWAVDARNNFFQSVVIQPLPTIIANP